AHRTDGDDDRWFGPVDDELGRGCGQETLAVGHPMQAARIISRAACTNSGLDSSAWLHALDDGFAVVSISREEKGGLGEDVAAEFGFVDLVDAAEPCLGVVQSDGCGGSADRDLVRSFDLDECRKAGPCVEVEGDLSPAPLFAVVLLVSDLG